MSEDILNEPKTVGRILHQRLLDGDVTAPAEIAELYMPVIIDKLNRRHPNLDSHLIETAAEDALLNYFGRPEQYNPAKLDLVGYLRMSANGDLLNLLEQEKSMASEQSLSEYVELIDDNSEHEIEVPDDFNLEAVVFSHFSPIWHRISELLPDPIDQETVLLMMEGERKTSAYAEVLGILDYPVKERTEIVMRHKDRIKKRLQRNIDRSEVNEDE